MGVSRAGVCPMPTPAEPDSFSMSMNQYCSPVAKVLATHMAGDIIEITHLIQ